MNFGLYNFIRYLQYSTVMNFGFRKRKRKSRKKKKSRRKKVDGREILVTLSRWKKSK